MRLTESRTAYLLLGLILGFGIATIWPVPTAEAVATDRSQQFAITTCFMNSADPLEGVFVLDFLTGNLKGAVLNRNSGKFNVVYERELVADFQFNPKKEPKFAIVSATAQLPSKGGVTLANSVLFIAELTTGKVIAYAFPYTETNRPVKLDLVPIDMFQFRAPAT